MRFCLKYLLVLFMIGHTFAQKNHRFNIDSLQKAFANKNLHDTLRLAAIHDIARSYIFKQPDTVLILAKVELEFAKKARNKKYEANAYTNMGISEYALGNLVSALEYYNKALSVWNEIPPAQLRDNEKQRISIIYNNMGGAFKDLGDYSKSLECHFKSLKLKEEIKDTIGISRSYGNIGVIYENIGEPRKSLDYYGKALAIMEADNDTFNVANTIGNMASVYEDLEEFEKALEFHEKGVKLKAQTNNLLGLANSYNAIGTLYEHMKNYPQAYIYHIKSLEAFEALKNKEGLALSLSNIARLQLRDKKYAEAEKNFLRSLNYAFETESLEDKKEAQKGLSELYGIKRDYTKALAFYKSYIGSRDSVFNEENTKKAVKAEMNYNFEKKESFTRAEQDKKEAVANAESHKQRMILLLISFVLLLVLIFAIFAYRSYLQKQKANIEIHKQKELIEEKQKEILDSIHYARRIQFSLLPNEKIIHKNILRLTKKI